jgi:hypothetical protein
MGNEASAPGDPAAPLGGAPSLGNIFAPPPNANKLPPANLLFAIPPTGGTAVAAAAAGDAGTDASGIMAPSSKLDALFRGKGKVHVGDKFVTWHSSRKEDISCVVCRRRRRCRRRRLRRRRRRRRRVVGMLVR